MRAAAEQRPLEEHGLAREQVVEIQRARMLAAVYEVACEKGAANTTVGDIVGRSGVSRRTFYEVFDGSEDCLLAALDSAAQRMAAVAVPALEAQEKWSERMRSALAALLQFIDEQPLVGRFAVVEALGGGARVLEHRQALIARASAAVDEGRDGTAAARELPPLTAEAAVGAVLAVVYARLLERGEVSLLELTSQLTSTVVLPYLGLAAARRELRRPPPKRVEPKRTQADPLKELDMRLTYRTVRVLMAVASAPDASNRRLADAAGVSDQGQISKLLTRLGALGLIENARRGARRGEANRWRLSARGRQIAEMFTESAARG